MTKTAAAFDFLLIVVNNFKTTGFCASTGPRHDTCNLVLLFWLNKIVLLLIVKSSEHIFFPCTSLLCVHFQSHVRL